MFTLQTYKYRCLNPGLTPTLLVTMQGGKPGKCLSFSEGCTSPCIVSLLWQPSLWRTARMHEREGYLCCYFFLIFTHLWKQPIPKMDMVLLSHLWHRRAKSFISILRHQRNPCSSEGHFLFSVSDNRKTFPFFSFQQKLTQLRSKGLESGLGSVTLKTC